MKLVERQVLKLLNRRYILENGPTKIKELNRSAPAEPTGQNTLPMVSSIRSR